MHEAPLATDRSPRATPPRPRARWTRCSPSRSLAALAPAAAFGLLLALAACPNKGGDDEDEPAVKPSALVATAPVERGDVEQTVTAFGVVEPAPAATAPVTADVDSTVVKLWVRAGQMVKKGDAIADVRGTKAVRLDAQKAQIDLDLAMKELAREKGLREQGLATNADVAQAQASLDKAKADVAALDGGGAGAKTVRAPAAGLVESVLVKPGAAVAAGGPLVLLSGAGGERVRLGVEPGDLAKIEAGAAVHLRALYGSDVVEGTVEQVQPQVNAETHAAGALAAVVGAPFLEGAMCRGDIVVRKVSGALVVPRASIVDGTVFLVAGGAARRVPVTIVAGDGARAAVTSTDPALAAGAPVVTTGAAELDDGMAVRTAAGASAGQPAGQTP